MSFVPPASGSDLVHFIAAVSTLLLIYFCSHVRLNKLVLNCIERKTTYRPRPKCGNESLYPAYPVAPRMHLARMPRQYFIHYKLNVIHFVQLHTCATYVECRLVENLVRNVDRSVAGTIIIGRAAYCDDAVSLIGAKRKEDRR